MELRFTWDHTKAAKNLRIHGVSFETATEVFADQFHIVVDNYLVEDEQRSMAIGMIGTLLLVAVVFVDRSEPGSETIHLVSARKAVAYEKNSYQEQFA